MFDIRPICNFNYGRCRSWALGEGGLDRPRRNARHHKVWGRQPSHRL